MPKEGFTLEIDDAALELYASACSRDVLRKENRAFAREMSCVIAGMMQRRNVTISAMVEALQYAMQKKYIDPEVALVDAYFLTANLNYKQLTTIDESMEEIKRFALMRLDYLTCTRIFELKRMAEVYAAWKGFPFKKL